MLASLKVGVRTLLALPALTASRWMVVVGRQIGLGPRHLVFAGIKTGGFLEDF